MIAAVLEKLKKPLVIHRLEVPKLDFGQVLIELKYSGICGRQLQEINGDKGKDNFLPHLMGHEGGGIVKKDPPYGCLKNGVKPTLSKDKTPVVGMVQRNGMLTAKKVDNVKSETLTR